MDNLISETNIKLQGIAENLEKIKKEYEDRLKENTKEMAIELEAVKKYKEEFYVSKDKVEKMNDDIEGFEADYQNLVERFKDDELANILIAANKEISSKIEERKRKIIRDKKAMNELVAQAEIAKEKLVNLNAEKAALELCLDKVNDACEFYTTAINKIIDYTEENEDCLSACFHDQMEENEMELANIEEEINNISNDDEIKEEEISEIEDIEEENVEEQETEEIEDEDDEDDDDEDDKTILMDSILDSDELNISEEDIEESLKDIDSEILGNDDELDEDDSLYDETK